MMFEQKPAPVLHNHAFAEGHSGHECDECDEKKKHMSCPDSYLLHCKHRSVSMHAQGRDAL